MADQRRLSEDAILDIISRYQRGETPLSISKVHGIRNGSVCRILKRRGIKLNQRAESPTEEQAKEIIASYSSGLSAEKIGEKMNFDPTTIRRTLKKNGIKIRPLTEKRTYQIQQDYFSQIDTQEKAYFLGFIYADGNLSKRGHGIRIQLHPKDIDILERFSNIIYGFKKIGWDRSSTKEVHQPYVPIYSKQMHDDLTRLGSPPNKTFLIRFPNSDIVPHDLLRHFVRGYFDGDGCLSITERIQTDNGRPVVDFTSNKSFIFDLTAYLCDELNLKSNKIGSKKGGNPETGNIQFCGFENAKRVLDFLYEGSTVHMKRKHDLYLELCNQIETRDTSGNRRLKKFNEEGRYGNFFIPNMKETLLSVENVKRMNEDEKKEVEDFLFSFYREGGFPFDHMKDDEILIEFNRLKSLNPREILKEGNILESIKKSGSGICRHFCPHFYEVENGTDEKPSIMRAFLDDEKLREAIRLTMEDERALNGNNLKKSLSSHKIGFRASTFNTTVAKFIFETFTKEGDWVFDCSMGFGHRLLGAMSVDHSLRYVGVDPHGKTVEGNKEIFRFLKEKIPGFSKEAELKCMGAEEKLGDEYSGKFGLCFSSIPYWNLEQYGGEGQAYEGRSYVEFINDWWRKSAGNIHSVLKDGGILALNVAPKIGSFNFAEDVANVVLEFGFRPVGEYRIQITKNNFNLHKDQIAKLESILIFQKR